MRDADFSVDLVALAGLPPLLDRRATEVSSGQSYLAVNATVHDVGPVAAIHELVVAHERAVVDIGRVLVRAAQRLSGRAEAVRAAVRAYAGSDHGSADALTRGFPLPVHHGRLPDRPDPAPGPDLFDAPWLVADLLTYPPDFEVEEPIGPQWSTPRGFAATQHRLLTRLATLDPLLAAPVARETEGYRWPARQVCGDWPGILASADCLTSLAGALAAVRASILTAVRGVERIWVGRAGAGCATILAADAARLDRIGSTLTTLAVGYRPVAEAARTAEGAVESVLASLLDEAATTVLGVGSDIAGLPALIHIDRDAGDRLRTARRLAERAAATTASLVSQLVVDN